MCMQNAAMIIKFLRGVKISAQLFFACNTAAIIAACCMQKFCAIIAHEITIFGTFYPEHICY